MFGKINPKQMQAMMKQLGINQEEVDANKVIIETDNERIIIENPHVLKVNMSGQETFQISGEIIKETKEEEKEEEKIEADIQAIVEQTGVSKEEAAIELEKNNFDLAETIINLKHKKK